VTLAIATAKSIGFLFAGIFTLGWIFYLMSNWRKAKPEVGSEIELAANRSQYLTDEELEGPKLERALGLGLVFLIICGVGLPLYWLNEPDRQTNKVAQSQSTLALWGSELYATTAQGGFNCAGCHGGFKGGNVPYTLTEYTRDANGVVKIDDKGNPVSTVRQVQWKAPALDTVLLRYSADQVKFVLTYGRPHSPMPAWGTAGGGPMNDQQLDALIAYLQANQLTPEQAKAQATTDFGTDGQKLFDAYCARCHSARWSFSEDDKTNPGNGWFGPALNGGRTLRQFPATVQQINFVAKGVDVGKLYGVAGQSSGKMPHFENMLTPEQISAIVDYERKLK
jgi:mono/diheme cytochrome c family protein